MSVSSTFCFVTSFSCRKTRSFEKSLQSHQVSSATDRALRYGLFFRMSGIIYRSSLLLDSPPSSRIQLVAFLGGVRDTVIGLRHLVTSTIFLLLVYRPTSIVNLCHFLDGIVL